MKFCVRRFTDGGHTAAVGGHTSAVHVVRHSDMRLVSVNTGQFTAQSAVSSVDSAASPSRGRRRCPRTCWSTPTRARTRASSAASASIRSPTWRSTPTSTQVILQYTAAPVSIQGGCSLCLVKNKWEKSTRVFFIQSSLADLVIFYKFKILVHSNDSSPRLVTTDCTSIRPGIYTQDGEIVIY